MRPSQIMRAEAFKKLHERTGIFVIPNPWDAGSAKMLAQLKATRTLPFPFLLTARAENLIHGRPDLKDTIRRLEAFADAGTVTYATINGLFS